jgi:hypothetical protein
MGFKDANSGGTRSSACDRAQPATATATRVRESDESTGLECQQYVRFLHSQIRLKWFCCRWISRTLARWGFTRKDLSWKSALKYTAVNVRAMAAYVAWILQQDWWRVKFLDEAIFRCAHHLCCSSDSTQIYSSKELLPSKGYAPAGQPAVRVVEQKRELALACFAQLRACWAELAQTYTLTVLTNLASPSGFNLANPRIGDNSAIDFLEDIVNFIDRGCLQSGDVLVSRSSAAETQHLIDCRSWIMRRFMLRRKHSELWSLCCASTTFS